MNKLYKNGFSFAKDQIKKNEKKSFILKITFLLLNIFIFLSTLFSSILTSLFISKLVFKNFETWYFFAIASSSAIASLFSSILNFFFIKESIKKYNSNLIKMKKQIFLFENKVTKHYIDINREYHLYLKISYIQGSVYSQREVKNGAG